MTKTINQIMHEENEHFVNPNKHENSNIRKPTIQTKLSNYLVKNRYYIVVYEVNKFAARCTPLQEKKLSWLKKKN